jgi:hypothetical protein
MDAEGRPLAEGISYGAKLQLPECELYYRGSEPRVQLTVRFPRLRGGMRMP